MKGGTMNWLIWVMWIFRIAFNLIGNINQLRVEVPEAMQSVNESRKVILDSLSGGLTEEEIKQIKLRIEGTWQELDDIFNILTGVVPVKMKQPLEI